MKTTEVRPATVAGALPWRLCLAAPLVLAVVAVLWIRLTPAPRKPAALPPPKLTWSLVASDRYIEAWASDGSSILATGEVGVFARGSATGDTWRDQAIVVASDAIPPYKDLPAIPARPILETTPGIAVAPDGAVVLVGGIDESADSTILRSTDAGRSWVRTPLVRAGLLTSVRFAANVGIATGPAGAILRSTDGGASWSPVGTPTDLNLFACDVTGSGRALAVGEQGVVLRSDGDGLDWQGAIFAEHSLYACRLLDDRRAFVAGAAGTILATADGGRSFVSVGLDSGDGLNRVPAVASLAVVDGKSGPLVVAGLEGGLVLVGRGDGVWSETHLEEESGTVTSLIVVDGAVLAATDTRHVYRADVTGQ